MRIILSIILWLGISISGVAGSPEREIAEWVIRQGGRVVLEGDRRPIGDVLQLPYGEVRISGIDLFGTLIEPKDLEKIGGLTGLKELYLPGPIWNPGAGSRLDANDQLKFLARLKSLEKLYLSLHFLTYINVQDKGLAYITGLTQLKELRCAQCRIAKLSLSPLVRLESLDLSLSSFNDEGMKGLEGLKQLRRLILRDTLVSDEGVKYLRGLTQLEELDLGGTKVTDVGFAQITDIGLDHLASLTNLTELAIGGNKLTDTGLQSLRQLPGLTSLDLSGSRRTDSGLWSITMTELGLEAITTLKGLRELRLDGMPVSNRWLEKLRVLGRIERLNLQGCKRVGDDASLLLASWPALRILDLKGTAMTERGVSDLRRAKPKAQVFHGP